jgi:phosphate transport system protein
MPLTADQFEQRSQRLQADLVEQGRRVVLQLEHSIESAFEADPTKAECVIEHDKLIDKADIEIERAAVSLLWDLSQGNVSLTPDQLRMVLMFVKVNNELERIADGAVEIAEQIRSDMTSPSKMTDRLRVMANSVLGILQNACQCFEQLDNELARVVLASDDATEEFESQILRELQRMVSSQEIELDPAFCQQAIAIELDRIGDHCTNIAEQVIYATTGNIVRHTQGQWTPPEPPKC